MKYSRYLIAVMLLSCRDKPALISPVRRDIMEVVYAAGKVKSHDQYEVFPSVAGIISKIYVTEGDRVKKGDVLLTLVQEAQTINRDNAALAARYQSPASNQDKLEEADLSVTQARSRMENDSALLVRQSNLWANDIGSRNELEQRQLNATNSALAYRSALARYEQVKRQIDFSGRQAVKSLQVGAAVLSDYSIRAREDGVIYELARHVGEGVSPLNAVAVIGSPSEFLLEFDVDENDAAKIEVGQPAFVTMDAYKGKLFQGKVTRVLPYLNERAHTVAVEVTLRDSPAKLFPNLTAEANIIIRQRAKALTIPRQYLVDDTTVLMSTGKQRRVHTGLKDYELVEVLQGLDTGDKIIKP